MEKERNMAPVLTYREFGQKQLDYENLLQRLARARINTFDPDDIANFKTLANECHAYMATSKNDDSNQRGQVRQIRQQLRGIIATCLTGIVHEGRETPDMVLEILVLHAQIFFPGKKVTITVEPRETAPV
jgi:hypothetical protein